MSLEVEHPAVPEAVALVRRDVRRAAQAAGLDGLALAEVVLAASEAATNVVLHAYREGPAGTLRVQAGTSGDDFVLTVSDDGLGLVPRDDSPGLGLGLPIITTVARDVDVAATSSGTQLRMVFPIPGRPT